MSNFDTVNRKMLLEELQEVLDLDEMYLISVLTNRPKIKVKIGNSLGEAFDTLVGIMQGDVLSAILFIFYLAKCLKHPIKTRMKGFLISPKYADDITYGGTCKSQIDEIEVKVPQKLEGHNLKVNESKTEKYIYQSLRLHLFQSQQWKLFSNIKTTSHYGQSLIG